VPRCSGAVPAFGRRDACAVAVAVELTAHPPRAMAQSSSGAEMPFLDHLEELRRRIFKCLGALIVGVIVAFTLITKFRIVEFLAQPVLPHLTGQQLVYTGPADAFKIVMGLSLALGFILALPVILWQLWSFVSPGLYKHEKRVVLPLIFFATLLFL